jgi:hypothetical protein
VCEPCICEPTSSTASFYKPPEEFKVVLDCVSAQPPVVHHVHVHGIPGIGKTAMAEAIFELCRQVRPSRALDNLKAACDRSTCSCCTITCPD